MSDRRTGYAVQPGEGERVKMLASQHEILAGRRTDASFTLLSSSMPAGSGPPPHIHDDEDELFYVLEGRLRVTCGDDEWVVGAGGCAYLPRGVMHQPRVEGDEPARALVLTSRPGLEDFFEQVTAEVASSGRPPDLEMMDRLGAPYGLRHFPPGTG
jgi:mannose-6-phosphate isomerase-like protein (cupin superfamily)